MKHTITVIALLFSLFINNTVGQTTVSKSLFFCQDSIVFVGCGNITYASVLLFVSDTSSNSNATTQYNIVIECPELYGNSFFKKAVKYKLVLSKDFKKMSTYFSKNIFSKLRKRKNVYLCEKIEVEQ